MADGSVRVGLIGAGNISATHARAVAGIPHAAVAAVYGPTLARAQALAAAYGARAYDALSAEAASAGVTLGVIFQDRVKPGVRALKARLDAGGLGVPRVVRAEVPWWRPPEYHRESRWRDTWR